MPVNAPYGTWIMDTLSERFPKTVERAVDILIEGMSFAGKTEINQCFESHKVKQA